MSIYLGINKKILFRTKYLYFTINSLFILLFSSNAISSDSKIYRSRDHAPIGVMRDHIHKKGEVMTSYRIKYMQMKGLRDGTDSVSPSDAVDPSGKYGYTATPLEMDMKMYMLGIMYGLTDDLTVSIMGGVVEKRMNHMRRNNTEFIRESDGISDIKINASHEFYNKNSNRLQVNLGLSLPTGSINQSFSNKRLPYPMQIGSGSYEFLPGLSYSGYKGIYYYGGQVNGVFRLNDNKHNYRLGNGHSITSWIARNINDYSSLSVRLDYNKVKDIEGADSTSAPSAIVTWDSSLQSREVLDILFGVNIIALGDDFGGGRLAFEFGMPIYQKIDGPALKNDYKIILGLQYSF